MILVTLGTQDKEFTRLLKAIDKEIEKGNIKEKVIVQAGYTKYKSDNMEIYDLIEMDELEKLTKKCNLLITHGGVGSILTGLTNNKKVIAAARQKKYKEHTNDHQKQIVKEFAKRGYLLELRDFNKLDKILEKVKTFKPSKYESNNKNFVKLLDNYIEKDNHTSWYNKYRSLTSCGYTGIIISLINVLIFGLLYSKVNLYLNIINSFVISSLVGLLFNILCDIKIKDNVGKYSFIKLLSLVLDISLMQVFYKMFNIEPILSKIIANIIILFINFVIIKFIFRKEEV